MLVMRIPVVIPTKAEWVILLLAIGFIGFVAQVRWGSPALCPHRRIDTCCAQFLLTAGLQRETAGRGTMAIYVQVRSPCNVSFSVRLVSLRLLSYLR